MVKMFIRNVSGTWDFQQIRFLTLQADDIQRIIVTWRHLQPRNLLKLRWWWNRGLSIAILIGSTRPAISRIIVEATSHLLPMLNLIDYKLENINEFYIAYTKKRKSINQLFMLFKIIYKNVQVCSYVLIQSRKLNLELFYFLLHFFL